MTSRLRSSAVLVACGLAALALWLRWPGLGFSLWNVDEAIHAAAARAILDGGVLYRDAIDQRTPLSYYAVAGVFAVAGENNLWAVRLLVALLVAATGGLIFVAGAALRQRTGGVIGGGLYVLLATTALFQGDANAANTEWFLACFTSAAAAVFLTGGAFPGRGRLLATGALLGAAFLSKQPALLDAAAPAVVLAYAAWRQRRAPRALVAALLALGAGWLAPVLLAAVWFAAHGALGDAVFYTWTYNLTYYGPEIATPDRVAASLIPLQLLAHAQPVVLALWLAGAAIVAYRLVQRSPTADEDATNPGLLYVAMWSLTAFAGAASSGRDFHHYTIQFLAPFSLGAGLVLGRVAGAVSGARLAWVRGAAALALAIVGLQAVAGAVAARGRTLPEDPSRRVAAYIREHSTPADPIFVWGFHPDIYLLAERRPASRFVYASFLSGLVPWTNTAPDRDTAYAIVPGTRETLLRELTARPPQFIVDCSAGPNRHWQKYPLETFPALAGFVRDQYELTEGSQFVAQGFRLYRRRPAGATEASAPATLPEATLRAFTIGTVAQPVVPEAGSAPFGASFGVVDGRAELFAHAPSRFVYRVEASVRALRGGYGIRPGAYAAGNPGPTDGATFKIRWVPDAGPPILLLNRTLLPAATVADRGVQSFRLALPTHAGGRIELMTDPGPAENPASDWTYWIDLTFEKIH
jgi:4-amino-4-deoxy-L-arabinose transferase-like glycosyltransferase